jgi:hypothetical protein
MTTKWINKEIFKEENFSTKLSEGFDNVSSSNKNPLEQFLKANPLKSIFDREPVDSRNEIETFLDDDGDVIETFSDDDGDVIETFLDDEKEWSNIVPFGEPGVIKNRTKKGKIKKKVNFFKSEKKMTRAHLKRDNALIKSITISLFSIFISLYVSYNWFFNVVEGFKLTGDKFYKKFDVVNYFYLFTEYFYKIVKFIDQSVSKNLPNYVQLLKGKERFIFILIFIISYFSVKSIIDFLFRIYAYLKTFAEKGKIDFFQILYNPKNNNIFTTILFFVFVLVGVIESFGSIKDSIIGKEADELKNFTENLDPSKKFQNSLMQFKIAHPICYLIILLIRVSITYGPTVSFSSMMFLFYFKFYSLLGISNYTSQPDDSKPELFKGVKSLFEMIRRIHAYINANHVFTEMKETDKGVVDYLELFLRYLFMFSPYIILFFGIFNVIPSILKIYSPTYKLTGIAIISILSIALFKFMANEIPILYVNIEKIKNGISTAIESLETAFSNVKNGDTLEPIEHKS